MSGSDYLVMIRRLHQRIFIDIGAYVVTQIADAVIIVVQHSRPVPMISQNAPEDFSLESIGKCLGSVPGVGGNK
jgi:hypothetical protein